MAGTRDVFNAFLDVPSVAVSSTQTGILAGLRLAVKDIFHVAGYRTGCGSPDRLADSKPADRTAELIERLLMSGAKFVGKTQTDEFAYSVMGINAHFPQPVNPAAPDRVSGGSSSGSATAIAAGLANIAIGSDTAGSIRVPASFCGLIGLRPTHGRIPLAGAMRLAPSFDTFGWFADDIETYEAVGRLLLGPDTHRSALTRPLTIMRIDALVSGKPEARAYEHSIEIVEKATALTELELPFQSTVEELALCLRRLQAYEAWRLHGAWLTAKPRTLGPGVRERFQLGARIDEKTLHAESVRRIAFRSELSEMLGKDGFLVLPTVPGAAPLKRSSELELQAYRDQTLKLVCLASLSGFPQITLPVGEVHGAPFGISLLGPPGSDIALIRLGRRILQAAGKGVEETRMDTLTRMRAFIDVVEAEGFSAAARKIGRSKALLSKYVRELEDELGALLLNRTTRQFSLTEAGHTYYRRATEIVREIDNLADAVRESSGDVRGRIKLSAPRTFADAPIGQALIDFAKEHPEIVLEIDLDDRFVDLVEEGFDLAIRITRLESSSLIARRLAPFSVQLCAAPELIAKYGAPRSPRDLAKVPCIIDTNGRWLSNWPFVGDDGELVTVSVSGPIEVNSPMAARAAAIAGLGFAILPDFIAASEIEAGRLVSLLDDRIPKGGGIFAVYPHRRYLPAKVRAFVDFLALWFKKFPCSTPAKTERAPAEAAT